jgi:hypothetical protein
MMCLHGWSCAYEMSEWVHKGSDWGVCITRFIVLRRGVRWLDDVTLSACGSETMLPAFWIQMVQKTVESFLRAGRNHSLIEVVQLQCHDSILWTVVHNALNISVQHVVRQKLERKVALVGQTINRHRIYDLRRRHQHVQGAEILAQAVPNESAAHVNECSQFDVRVFEGVQPLARRLRIQIADLQAAEASQVINDWLHGGNVVVKNQIATLIYYRDSARAENSCLRHLTRAVS